MTVNSPLVFFVILIVLALTVTYIDVRKQIIPDFASFLLLFFGFVSSLSGNLPSVWLGISGAVAGFACLFVLQHLYRSARGFDGLGGGDVKFVAAAGMWVGFGGLPWLVLIASVSGLVAFVVLAALGRAQVTSRMPFGPHLAFGLVLTWLALQQGLL